MLSYFEKIFLFFKLMKTQTKLIFETEWKNFSVDLYRNLILETFMLFFHR